MLSINNCEFQKVITSILCIGFECSASIWTLFFHMNVVLPFYLSVLIFFGCDYEYFLWNKFINFFNLTFLTTWIPLASGVLTRKYNSSRFALENYKEKLNPIYILFESPAHALSLSATRQGLYFSQICSCIKSFYKVFY